MTQKIKVHRMREEDGQEEISEMDLPEAERIIEYCHKWNCLIVDTKTREVIREIVPGVGEITIYFPTVIAGG